MRTLPFGIIIPNRPDPANIWRLDAAPLPMIVEMERNGMLIDRQGMGDLHKRLTLEMDEISADVEKITGYSTNLGSGDQLADLLFVKLGLKQQGKEKWTKSRARLAADSDVLEAMISKHSCIRRILDWKVRSKLKSSFTYSLLAVADENDRIHPDINHTGTETGRYACNDPNLQTIPTRNKLGKEVRKCFIAERGNLIGCVDASQIEIRHTAWDSQCPNLMKIYTTGGGDIYWSVAEAAYKRTFTADERKNGVDPESGLSFKDAFRQNAKTITLGVNYAISPAGLVDQFLSSGAIRFLTGSDEEWDYDRHYDKAVQRCAEVIMNFFEGFPEVLQRRREHHRRARKHGMVWCLFGRHRWIPQCKSTHRWIVEEGLRAAGNHPTQGGCAGILKLWLAVMWMHVESYWKLYGIRPLITVHDEAIFEGPRSVLEDFLPECAYILERLLPPELYNVPLKASYAMADSWGNVEK